MSQTSDDFLVAARPTTLSLSIIKIIDSLRKIVVVCAGDC